MFTLEPGRVEEAVRELYIRALKRLPTPVAAAIDRLAEAETSPTGRAILETMRENIRVAGRDDLLLCQDTGIPVLNLTIGRGVVFEGAEIEAAAARGVARATREHPLRSSVVHPITRVNAQDSTGPGVPVVHVAFGGEPGTVRLDFVPKGSGSENGSFLGMLLPADGLDGVKRFVVDAVLEAGGKVCPPTIVGVGLGGTSDVAMHLAKRAATRPLGGRCPDPHGAALEEELTRAVNRLGIGPQGLGGDATAFAVQVELAATHITLNPVAVNIQCHAARRASAELSAAGIVWGE